MSASNEFLDEYRATCEAIDAIPHDCPECGGHIRVKSLMYPYAVMMFGQCTSCSYESEPRRTDFKPIPPKTIAPQGVRPLCSEDC